MLIFITDKKYGGEREREGERLQTGFINAD